VGDALAVRRVQSVEDLAGQSKGLIQRHGSFQRLTVDVLHDEIVRTHVIERADVGMIQRGDGFGFPLEALREMRGGNLDRDFAIQPRIACPIHLAHSTSADGRKYFVRSEFVADRERHRIDAEYIRIRGRLHLNYGQTVSNPPT
jgi:hypothetical protein